MTNHKDNKTVWIGVWVQSGVPTDVEVYFDKKIARRRHRAWRKQMKMDYDEVSIFEEEIRVK